MSELTTYERIKRMYEHREADRVPIVDSAWESTRKRWEREGLPAGVPWNQYFGLDRVVGIGPGDVDTSPRFEAYVIEETDTHRIERTRWGATVKNFKPVSSTPQDLDFAIKDPDTWREAKARMAPSRDRVNWARIQANYRRWREEGAWVIASPWFGYDIVNARMCGTERIMLAMAEDPEWCRDMFDTLANLALALTDMVWDAGYTFDEIRWPDDMGYRNGMLFSPRMYRELVKPYQQRVIEWAHAKGIKAHIHSCGNISAVVPEFVGIGLDGLDPLEIKAGMDPLSLKSAFGDRLLLQGGFDVRNWIDPDQGEADVRRLLPTLMESGGYVFSSDHSIADSISLASYRRIVEVAKEVGRY